MLQYIKNIVPRIQQHSKQLDKTEIFVEKSWIYIDESNNNHEYMFMRDKRLIMSLNGSVTSGTWELLPNGKMLINRVKDEVLLQNMFFDDALMVLQKSGSNDDPFTLVNVERIPDLDAVRYLNKVEESALGMNTDVEIGTIKILPSGSIIARYYDVGYKVINQDGSLVTGIFPIPGHRKDAHMEVKNGIVESIFFIIAYKNVRKQIFKVKQIDSYTLKGGVIIGDTRELGLKSTEPNMIFSENNEVEYKVDIDENGLVTKEYNSFMYDLFMFLGLCFVAAIVIFTFAKLLSNY